MNRQERRRQLKLQRKQGLAGPKVGGEVQERIDATIANVELLLKTGRLDAARQACEQAIAADPGQLELHRALGVVLQAGSDHAAAIEAYEAALAINPRYLPVLVNLAVCAREIHDPQKALGALDAAIALDGRSVHAHFNKALVFCDLRNLPAAIEELHIVLKLKPDFANAHHQLGFLEEMLENYDAAIGGYTAAIAHNPATADYYLSLGSCLQTVGRFEEAETPLRKAISLRPTAGRAHFLLAYSDQADSSEAERARLARLIAESGATGDDLINMHFASGRLNERAGDHEAAFTHFSEGNALRDADVVFDADAMRGLPNDVAEIFDGHFFALHEQTGNPTDRPIFVVGMPRSGTTLVEQIIAAHPKCYGAGELMNLDSIGVTSSTGSSPEEHYPGRYASIADAEISALAERYLADYPAAASDAKRVVDKTPGNALALGALAVMFPNARFISCRRDPMDICWSIYRHNFLTDLPYASDFEKMAVYYHTHDQTMAHWRKVLGNRILDVDYETLVADPEPTIRSIIDFCGVEWDQKCLAFHELQRGIHSMSLWTVRQPIFNSSIGAWKRYERRLQPLQAALGDISERA